MKLAIKKWNDTEFGNVTFKKQQLWNKLNDLDVREETQPLTAEEKLEQVNLRTKIEKLTLLEEIRLVGGRSLGCYTRGRGTQIPNFFIEWLIPIEKITVLKVLWLMESCLPIKVRLLIVLLNSL